jgi:parvulin-like peptidyl-prolyl isomerase
MNLSGKVLAVVLLVLVLAGAGISVQSCSSSPKPVTLTARDMQLFYQEVLPPDRQREIANNPEKKAELVNQVKQLLAVAQLAEAEGYMDRPEVRSRASLEGDIVLFNAYRKKNPEAKASDEEITQYSTEHPRDFDEFLSSDPRASQAQGAQREDLRRRFTELKIFAQRARKEKLDQEELTRLQALLARCQPLASAYVADLQKETDQSVTDADVDQYFAENASEFEELRVRHILVSTMPVPPAGEDEQDAKPTARKEPEKPKTLTKEEAAAKAQQLLERVRKGEDFAKLAEEHTDDPGSKKTGGEYVFGKGRMTPAFEKAAFALQPGQVSELVETEYGYHIIKLEERRNPTPSQDPKVKTQVTDKIKEKRLEDRVNQIARDSGVVVAEDFDTTPKAPVPASAADTTPAAPPAVKQ